MEVFDDMDQGSPAWFELHRGLPTASEFHKVMAKVGPRGGTTHSEYVMRAQYMRVLAAELYTGECREPEWFGNRHTERGKAREDEARSLYAMTHRVEPRRVAFVRNGICGCSPDSLVGADGGLELKDVLPHRQVERLQSGALPPEHRWQVIGSLLVCEDREWWDFVSHSRGLPLFEFRVYRSKVAVELAELRAGIERFAEETAQLVRWIGAMG